MKGIKTKNWESVEVYLSGKKIEGIVPLKNYIGKRKLKKSKMKTKNASELNEGDVIWCKIPFKVIEVSEKNGIISVISEEERTKFKYVFDSIATYEVEISD